MPVADSFILAQASIPESIYRCASRAWGFNVVGLVWEQSQAAEATEGTAFDSFLNASIEPTRVRFQQNKKGTPMTERPLSLIRLLLMSSLELDRREHARSLNPNRVKSRRIDAQGLQDRRRHLDRTH